MKRKAHQVDDRSIRREARPSPTAISKVQTVMEEGFIMQHFSRLQLEHQIRIHNRLGMEIANNLLADTLGCGEEKVGLLELPQDVRLLILDFVDEQRDLGDYACVSKQCLADTNHPSLEHLVRWARLIVRPETEVVEILTALKGARECGVFENMHGLLIEFTSGRYSDNRHANLRDVKYLLDSMRLSTVTHLELTAPLTLSRDGSRFWSWPYIKYCVPNFLSKIMPNLKSITIDSNSGKCTASSFAIKCKKLESFRWYRSFGRLGLDGQDFKKCRRLKHLSLDGCIFYFMSPSPHFLLHVRSTIEEISVLSIRRSGHRALPPEWILEFIRTSPRLRRFRTSHCVLSARQISLARLERPDVTFIVAEYDDNEEYANKKW